VKIKTTSLFVVLTAILASSAWATLKTNVTITFSPTAQLLDIDWSHNHDFIALGYEEKVGVNELEIYRWQTNSLNLTESVNVSRDVTAVAWRRDGYTFAYGNEVSAFTNELNFHAFNSSIGKFSSTNRIELVGTVYTIDWRPEINRTHVMVGYDTSGAELSLYNYDGISTSLVTSIDVDGITDRIISLNGFAWHPDGRRFAVGFSDSGNPDLISYSNTTGNTFVEKGDDDFSASFDLTGLDYMSNRTAFALGLTSVSAQDHLKIYRFAANQNLELVSGAKLVDPFQKVNAVAWGPFDHLLAVGIEGSQTNRLLVYRVDLVGTGGLERLYQRDFPATEDVNVLKWSRDGKFLAVGTTAKLIVNELMNADLAVKKTNAPPAMARPGSNMVYVITVTNSGPDSVPSPVTVYDTLPTGVTYVTATSRYGVAVSTSGQVVQFTWPVMNVRSSDTVYLTAAVDSNLRTILTNKVRVQALMADSNVGNNTNQWLTYTDFDGDGFADVFDKCPELFTSNNVDSDLDGLGNDCDNCPAAANTNQLDTDLDSIGNVCDNCPTNANLNQLDSDADFVGNVCDTCPFVYNPGTNQVGTDTDLDTVLDICDNCPTNSNPEQFDADLDGIGDVCDNCPDDQNVNQLDLDGDGFGDACDPCPDVLNTNINADMDGDTIPDECDPDRDGDQLPNDWEELYGFNPSNPNTGDFETYLDADVDGVLNLEEFIAGSHPGDNFSYPQLFVTQGTSNPVVSWPGVTGRLYDLLVSTNLLHEAGWLMIQTGVPGTGPALNLTITNGAPKDSYYQFKVYMAP